MVFYQVYKFEMGLIKVVKNIIKNFAYSGFICAVGLALFGCNKNVDTESLAFSLQIQDEKINCGQSAVQGMELSQFWFYLSQIRIEVNGEWRDVTLPNTKWQHDNVALIGQHCSDNTDKNWQLTLSQGELIDVKKLAFSIAVPFELNHQNPLKAQSIFDNANMFWTWQQGYKSLRLDLKGDNEGWAYHIGAVGCKSPSVMRAPTTPCRELNHINVELVDVDVNKPITIDLARVIEGIGLSKLSRCLSMPSQHSCAQLMINMTDTQSPVFYQ